MHQRATQDFALAEQMYQNAIHTDPNHANSLYNYGVLLDSHLSRKKEAEQLYRRALESNPTHPYALYNLAVLIEESRENLDEAYNLYARVK